MKPFSRIYLLISFFFISFIADAQRTSIFQNPVMEFNSAIELFQKEKFGAAQKRFLNVASSINDPNSLMQADAEYYAALCAMELFHDDAESRLLNFINDYPEHEKVHIAWFQLGRFQYRKRSYRYAIASFNMINPLDLNNDEQSEYYFKLGYSYFRARRMEEANKNLFLAKNRRSRYTAPATYYYSHIAYTRGSYETALHGFQALIDDPNFKALIPYYITQIYFLQQKYDELLKVAPPLLEVSVPRRKPEISRLIGEAYYHTNRYREAIPYLEMYRESTPDMNRNDFYQIGYAYYRIENYESAIKHFELVSGSNDSLAQNAYYHLGDCYLKTNNKQYAYNSFLAAYRIGVDRQIKESSLFNYAKLAFELSYNPYNEAINAFIKYIEEYPNSPRIDEANTFLVNLYMGTRNYKSALESLENIKKLNEELRTAYQKISYLRAIELFNNARFRDAIEMFDKSRKYTPNNRYLAESLFWSGESYFRISNYDKAAEYFNAFLISPGAIMLDYYNKGNYNLGYSYFKLKQYGQARFAFQKFINSPDTVNVDITSDAYLRTADCLYLESDFRRAVQHYNYVIRVNRRDADYAMYQKAMSEGAMGDYVRKNETLIQMTNEFPKSNYSADAKQEIAATYSLLEDNQKAMEYNNVIIRDYPGSLYAKKARLNIGLILFNTEENARALETLKSLADEYPGTVEARQAIETIKNIYVEINQVDEFFKWTRSRNISDISTAEQDSLTYIAAERIYMNGDCKRASESFTEYLEKFPNGFFVVDARFYRAECAIRNARYQDAIRDYEIVASLRTKFTESALNRLAYIYFEMKDYQKAYDNYLLLEDIARLSENVSLARTQQMRAAMHMERYDLLIPAARKVLATPKISQQIETEAHLNIGKAAMAIDSTNLAKTEFGWVIKNSKSEHSGEARYRLAMIEYEQANLRKSETLIHELINQVPSYEYWIASGLILLSDILMQRDNTLQAKAILQSIIDNYEGEDLKTKAQNKLNSIIEAENRTTGLQESIDNEYDDENNHEEEPYTEEIIEEQGEGEGEGSEEE